jgi:hypothetical protein
MTLHITGATVKAAGEYELDVLAAPYGGPVNGKDLHGEYFDAATKFHEDKWPLPPAVYYHGYDPASNNPSGEPDYIGRATGRTVKADGVWYRVVLDRASKAAQRVWEAAKRGAAVVSSGSITHLTRTEKDGRITHWPIAEISIWESDTGRKQANAYAVALPAFKTLYAQAGIGLPTDIDPPQAALIGAGDAQKSDASADPQSPRGIKMDKELEESIAVTVANAIKADRDAQALKAQEEAAIQARIDAAVKAAQVEMAPSRRLADGGGVADVSAPVSLKFGELRKYANLDAADTSLLIELTTARYNSGRGAPPSDAAYKALAIKLEESQTEDGEHFRYGLKAAGLKANEVMQSTLTGFGDEWVSTAWDTSAWEVIRQPTSIVGKIPTITIPQGAESVTMPLEGADPTWYKVAQTTAINATTLTPDATVPTSQFATGQKIISAAKMGARVLISGELEEDSIVPIISQLRMQLATSAAEMLEHVVIDGDTATGATTNINDIGGTPAATDLFLLLNGFRKSCLVTTTANSRAGGTLTSGDFLATVQLMGSAGLNAWDISKVGFIVDPNVHWAALELADVKSRDVFAAATIESGRLSGLYGYQVNVSAWMHYMSSVRKANTAGKVDRTTPGNNTTGSILAVRWDQWRLAYKRRITIETVRVPRSDHTEVTALLRVGLGQRDTEASAISYGITVS